MTEGIILNYREDGESGPTPLENHIRMRAPKPVYMGWEVGGMMIKVADLKEVITLVRAAPEMVIGIIDDDDRLELHSAYDYEPRPN